MPFLFGVGYVIPRGAALIARACGARVETQARLASGLARATFVLDPVGSALAWTHGMVDVGAEIGNETCRKISNVLSETSMLDRGISTIGQIDETLSKK